MKSALTLARWASCSSRSAWACDLKPSWKASAHRPRYCGGPSVTGVGVGSGATMASELGLTTAAGAAWAVHAKTRRTSAASARRDTGAANYEVRLWKRTHMTATAIALLGRE